MSILSDYQAGLSIREVSEKHGISRYRVRMAILSSGATMRSCNPPIRIYPQVPVLYRQGKPRRAILKAVGCSNYAFDESLRAAGIIPDFRKKERTTAI